MEGLNADAPPVRYYHKDGNRSTPVSTGWGWAHTLWFLTRFGIAYEDFAGHTRGSRMVRARELCAYLLRHWPGPSGMVMSFPEIAVAMGRPNHSSVFGAYRRAAKAGHKRDPRWVANDLDSVDPEALVREAIESHKKGGA